VSERQRADGSAVEPSEAQIEAGNYPKGHVTFQGLNVTIETPKGGVRRGMGADGKPWIVKMPARYGYIRRTMGADDEQLDCYLGPDSETERVWIVHQNDPETGEFDEHKVMLGFPDRAAAIATYVAGFSDGKGAERIGEVVPTTVAGLKRDIAADNFRADAADLTDHQTAEAIRDGDLPSPTKYGDFWLFDLRITGTGMAFRDARNEFAHRDPDVWLSDEFLARCAGLTVIFVHPPRSLDSEEYRDRAIGSIVLPYIKGDEVWGIAKIFDAAAAAAMQTTHISTSPGVLPPEGATPITLESGAKVLDEPLPAILDHLAVCEAGVWDKDGPPSGIRLDASTRKDESVTEEERKKLEEERDDARRRADAAEKDLVDAKKRADDLEMDAKKRHDADEAEKALKDKADRKARHDCARMDGESDEEWEKRKADARKDETPEEKVEREEREDKARKDAAKVVEIDADKGTRLNDSKTVAELKAQVQTLTSRLEVITKPQSFEERNAIAARYDSAKRVYGMLGEQAPLHLTGESLDAYRRRLIHGLAPNSPRWKDFAINDAATAGPLLDTIEEQVYADAEKRSREPIADGKIGILRGRRLTATEADEQGFTGKTVVRFDGSDTRAWAAPFMPPVKHRLTGINTQPAGSR
jgi:hypothetical protein